MQPIKVSSTALRNMENLQQAAEKRGSGSNQIQTVKRIYSFWLNDKGAMEFVPTSSKHSFKIEETKFGHHKGHLVVEERNGNIHFTYDEMENVALKAKKVMQETLSALNALAKNEQVILHDVEVQTDGKEDKPELEPGWREMKHTDPKRAREEAEKLLKGQPAGTYLIRKENKTLELIKVALKVHFPNLLDFYILTVVAGPNQIKEKTLVRTSEGWTVLSDNLDLSKPIVYEYRPTFFFLMQSLRSFAKTPLSISSKFQNEGEEREI